MKGCCCLQSGIHGWGLIAKQEMKQDSMIIEYRGESVRRAMADAREKVYRVKDMDCYLFNINDDAVVDATVKGTIGRFTVKAALFCTFLAKKFRGPRLRERFGMGCS